MQIYNGRNFAAHMVVGSHAYGTNVQDSDVDTLTVYMPKPDHLLGLEKAKREGGDRSTYYLHDVVHLLIKGSPNMFEALYIPTTFTTKLWDELCDMAPCFITQRLANSMRGYLQNMIDRVDVRRYNLWHGKGVFTPKEHEQLYGWDTKAGAHVVRLAMQMDEICETYQLVFPLDCARTLRDIREGRWSYDDWKSWVSQQTFIWGRLPQEPEMWRIREYLKKLYAFVLEL
jgi:predicted nucleotidyltransferase